MTSQAARDTGLTQALGGTSKRTLSAKDFEIESTTEELERTNLLFEAAHRITDEQACELRMMNLDAMTLGLYAYETTSDGFVRRLDPFGLGLKYIKGEWILHTPEGPERMTTPAGPRFCSAVALLIRTRSRLTQHPHTM